jgi:glutamine synthetase
MIEAADTEFLAKHPDLESIDLLLVDANGQIRGKRIDASAIEKVFEDGITLPASIFGCDITGTTVESTGLGLDIGDRDYLCFPVPGSLQTLPWADVPAAQVMLDMKTEQEDSFPVSSRRILSDIVARFLESGLRPTVAVELEFYLLAGELDSQGMPVLPANPITGRQENSTQVYSINDLDDYKEIIDSIRRYTKQQGIPASAASSEYAPGQFEINLMHSDDPLAACDEAILLKRVIKTAAKECGYTATFMAKPFIDISGSGTHIHASLYDQSGANVFSANKEYLTSAIGGLQASANDSMLICAPHANSYRRFQSGSYVPLNAAWGFNNRTVALRIPAGDEESRRIEHRIAGADTNPYLVTAVVLAGILDGIENQLSCDEPIEGNAYEKTQSDFPTDWLTSIQLFEQSKWVENYFGKEFQQTFAALKRAELDAFNRQVTPLEIEWYLTTT